MTDWWLFFFVHIREEEPSSTPPWQRWGMVSQNMLVLLCSLCSCICLIDLSDYTKPCSKAFLIHFHQQWDFFFKWFSTFLNAWFSTFVAQDSKCSFFGVNILWVRRKSIITLQWDAAPGSERKNLAFLCILRAGWHAETWGYDWDVWENTSIQQVRRECLQNSD